MAGKPRAAALGDGMSKIDVTDASKCYATPGGASFTALSGATLRIEVGSFVCLLGPSGCGKTTLLNLIAGFERPSSGTVRIDGADVAGPNPRHAVIFQDYGLFPWLTVERNVLFGLEARNVPADEARERAQAQLRLVGLTLFSQSFPHQLSGGMKQRVALARALAVEPDVLLMDEPFGALDAFTRYRLQDELQRLHREKGLTIVFVTHDLDEAIYLADHVALMAPNPGRIERVIDVHLPRPCDRASSAFQEYRRQVFEAFHLIHEEAMEFCI